MAIDRLAYKLVMDHKQFVNGAVASRKELNLAKQVMFETQTPAQKYQKQIDSLGGLLRKGAITQRQYNEAVKQLKKPASDAGRSLTQQALAFVKLNPALVAATAATGALAIATVAARKALRDMTEAISEQFTAVDRLGKLSTSLGIGTSELATFGLIAEEAGSDLEGFNKSLKTMQKNLGDATMGTGEAQRWLDRFGVSAQALSLLAPEKQFLAITEAISRLPTQIERASAANAIFGRGAQNILRLLTLTGEEFTTIQRDLEAYGFAIDKIDASAIEMANDAWGRLGVIMDGLARTVAIELAPAILVIAQDLAAFAKTINLVNNLKAAFVGLRVVLQEVAAYFDVIVSMAQAAEATRKFIASGFNQLGGDVEQFVKDMHEAFLPRNLINVNEFFDRMDETRKQIQTKFTQEPLKLPIEPDFSGGGFRGGKNQLLQGDPGDALDYLFGGPVSPDKTLDTLVDKLGLDTSGIGGFTPLAGEGPGSLVDLDRLSPLGTARNIRSTNLAIRGSQEDIALRAASRGPLATAEDKSVDLLGRAVAVLEKIEEKTEGVIVSELAELPT